MTLENTLSGQEYLRKILLARIYPVARITPLHKLEKLSDRLSVGKVYLKREDYQSIHSFKIRGAYNKMRLLSKDQLACGVVAASAGNHAQGVALSAKDLDTRAVIVMPTTTPDLKVDAVRRFGAEVVLFGESFNEAYEHAKELSKSQGLTMIPPYDDPDVIAGQGTIAHELLGQCNDISTIFVQIGGGGMAAGIAVYIKNLIPSIKVIGVEAEGSASMKAACENGSPCNIGFVSHFADGVAVSRAGDETFRLCNEYLDDIITCSNDEICAAMKDIFDDTRAIAEPSGALALAGLKKYVRTYGLKEGNHVAIMSGANVKFHTLRMVAERCDVGEMAEGIFSVEIPEVKGSFLKFCETIGNRHVTEFSYRVHATERARIFASIELSNGQREIEEISASLHSAGYGVTDLTNDAISKDHIRYMIGGHLSGSGAAKERLFLFEFPETKGALTEFLTKLGGSYSISLFHFRISGLEYCSVLCGFDVSDDASGANLDKFLEEIKYPVVEVTNNPAYKQFLG